MGQLHQSALLRTGGNVMHRSVHIYSLLQVKDGTVRESNADVIKQQFIFKICCIVSLFCLLVHFMKVSLQDYS